jgi:hypothetical protein
VSESRVRPGPGAGSARTALRAALDHRALPLVLIALALALALGSLTAGLHLDDYVVLAILAGRDPVRQVYPARLDVFNFFDGSAERTRRMMDLGVIPWWTAPDLKVAFWRPLTALTHWIDAAAWPDRPVLMHAHSLAWFAALVLAVWLMYRQFLTPGWIAGLAALLYTVDDGHALSVAWVSGRNALVATAFGALAISAHDRWRRCGARSGALLAPLCLALALLAGESAVAVAAYLAAHALCLDSARWPRRLLALVPGLAVVLGWLLLYGGLGYGAFGAGPGYLSPVREPALFARALAANAPVMLLAQWGGPSAESYVSLGGTAALVRWSIAVGALGGVGLLLAPLLRRDAVARFLAIGQLLALVPAGAASPSDRYLFFVGLGATGLIARFLASWVDGEAWRPASRAWRAPAAALAGLLLIVHLLVAPVRLAQAVAGLADLGLVAKAAADSLPAGSGGPGELLIIPTVPRAVIVSYGFFMRAVKGEPLPAGTRLLAAGAPVELYRPDPRTLVVRLLGPAERMFRAPEAPLSPGTRVDLAGTRAEVTAVDAAGLPAEVIFRFDRDLDSAGVRWARWRGPGAQPLGFVPLQPPPVGGHVRVD